MKSLADWLEFQQRQHSRDIALGLDRVRALAEKLALPRPAPCVITVGGTNGKGSTVAFLDAILRASGYRVGAYTSPHLLRYNERIRIDGCDVSDSELVEAFERIEAARGDIPLTYFEFGTLAALMVFEQRRIDVAVLEVGLGGRLDAVNLVDADAAIVTTVDLDHLDYLGSDRDTIGFEKAGIFRAGRPAIVAEPDPPRTLVNHARAIGALLEVGGHDFGARTSDAPVWQWWHRDGTILDLPRPRLVAPAQLDNASAAIAALHALRNQSPVARDALAHGVANATAPARLQRFPGPVEIVVDVGHNPQSAREIARWLAGNTISGRTLAVFAALGDKDIAGIVAPLAGHVAHWFFAGLSGESPRGVSSAELAQRCAQILPEACVELYEQVIDAIVAARVAAAPGDRVLVFGSFFTAAAALQALS